MKQLTLVMIAAITLAGCREEDTAGDEVVRAVSTFEVVESSDLHDRFFVGVARAARQATLAFGVPGTVQTLNVAVGDRVVEGDQMAALDSAPFEADVARSAAEVESARATLANAKAQADRQRILVEQDVAAQARLDTFAAQEGSAEGAVRAAQAALDRATLDLSYTRIGAPYDGVVVATYVEVFEEVPAQANIVRILDARDIEMVIDVPERFISILPRIKDLRVSFTALGDLELPAEVTEVGAEASVTTGTFPVTLQMAQPDGRLILPGMTGRARGTPTGSDTLLSGIFVPPAAVFTPEGGDQPHVWVVDEATMTVVERPVSLGAAGSLGIAITEGLQPGEIAVAAGANSLRSGQTIVLFDDKAP